MANSRIKNLLPKLRKQIITLIKRLLSNNPQKHNIQRSMSLIPPSLLALRQDLPRLVFCIIRNAKNRQSAIRGSRAHIPHSSIVHRLVISEDANGNQRSEVTLVSIRPVVVIVMGIVVVFQEAGVHRCEDFSEHRRRGGFVTAIPPGIITHELRCVRELVPVQARG